MRLRITIAIPTFGIPPAFLQLLTLPSPLLKRRGDPIRFLSQHQNAQL